MRAMIRYKLKPDRVNEALTLLRAAYEEMDLLRPGGLTHSTHRLDDGVSFVDFVVTVGRGPGPLPTLPAFGRFRRTLDSMCEEPVQFVELHEVGSFNLHTFETIEKTAQDRT